MGRENTAVAAAGGVAGEEPLSCAYSEEELNQVREGKTPSDDERMLATIDELIGAWELLDNRASVLETLLCAILLKQTEPEMVLSKLEVASVLSSDSLLVKKHPNGMDWVLRLKKGSDKTLDVTPTSVESPK